MNKSKWDQYFYSHYKPIGAEWARADIEKYQKWYYAWIKYIDLIIHFEKFPGAAAFEIGSGIGATTALLKEHGLNITGSDISKSMVKAANRAHTDVRFVYYDVQMPLRRSGIYYFIFGFEVLEHIPHPAVALKNIWNALRPGGYFIGSTPYPFPKGFSDPTHSSVNYPQEWRRLFLQNRFQRVMIRPMSFVPMLWRISKYLNPIIPFYIPFNNFVSTTLIIAQK